MKFATRLAQAVRRTGNPICVGLDPRWGSLPDELRGDDDRPAAQAAAFEKFCCGIIDVVAGQVPIVKPQAAFFEQIGPSGMVALGHVIDYARSKGLLTILDGKRNDIGSTAIAYAEGWLGRESSPWGADSLTVSPYLGDDSLEPFAQTASERDAGLFILVKTSNPGGGFLQDEVAQSTQQTVYRSVAQWISEANKQRLSDDGWGPVGAVVGATYPEQLQELRQAMPQAWLLVPGYGAQGGGAKDVMAAFDQNGLGAVINSSRGIIFAHQNERYADALAQGGWQAAVDAATKAMVQDLSDAGYRVT